jgi:hypothetical protein
MRTKIGLIVLFFALGGCVSDRWLTVEEDAAFKAQCENKNCVIVPGALWEQIKAALEAALGTRI